MVSIETYPVAIKDSMLWIPIQNIHSVDRLKDRLTFKPRFNNIKSVETFNIDLENGLFGLPRNTPVHIERVIDHTTDGLPAKFRFLGKMRDYQVPLIESFKAKINNNKRDLMLIASTGAGKTVLMLKMINLLGRAALVIVPKTDLVNQWRQKILEFTDLPASRIGIAQQDVCDYEGKSIVIGMVHSLYKDKYPEDFKKHFGTIIYDESHRLSSFHFSKVVGMFPAKYRIAASATPNRSDGLESVFTAHIGTESVKLERSEQPIPKVAVYEYINSSGQIPSYLTDIINKRGVLLTKLAKNSQRTAIITKFAVQLMSSDRQTLVVSERTAHLKAIYKLMLQMGVPKEDIGFYLGSTSKKERQRVAEECSCILGSMSMLSLGTDIPTLRGLVIATPISQAVQPLGRIRRIDDSLRQPFVVDVYDSAYPECRTWLRKRLNIYESQGCEVNYITQ